MPVTNLACCGHKNISMPGLHCHPNLMLFKYEGAVWLTRVLNQTYLVQKEQTASVNKMTAMERNYTNHTARTFPTASVQNSDAPQECPSQQPEDAEM